VSLLFATLTVDHPTLIKDTIPNYTNV